MLEFVEKLRAGAVRIVDARALDHHAKVYIADETVAIVASSNVSQRGFLDAIKSGTVITQREDVLAAINAYIERRLSGDLLVIVGCALRKSQVFFVSENSF